MANWSSGTPRQESYWRARTPERRTLLENLFSEQVLTPPWTLCPMTTDLAKARERLRSWTDVSDVSGVVGIVIEPLNSGCLTGYRGWQR
ncbi:hypothetical protein [Streptomyces sp. NBC_01565]|uniref:hypothetical protein n=1 Tax=unclassified Streptomyces TaxID=2593676 RepID=UPI002254326F|nr:hypothetical protein [Streptomyces sp. NBC_01565]MCX4546381.1 hypothetical protein [Streptomyces sp. NBC_01565]